MKKLFLVCALFLVGCSSTENISINNEKNIIKKADIISIVIKSQYWDSICANNKEAKESTVRAIKLFHTMSVSEKEGTLDLLFSREQRLWYHKTKIRLMITFDIYK